VARKEAAAMQVLIRLILEDRPGSLSLATAAIARIGGNILAMDVVDREGPSVVDDFVIQLDDVDPAEITRALTKEPGMVVDCVRVTPQVELHRELELISTLATSPRPSLELLARLVPAIVVCDWAVIISSAGSGVAVTHASPNGPRVRWTSLPWMPLKRATALDTDESWVPSSLHSEKLSLSAAPVDERTCVLACRFEGPSFRRQEVERLARLGRLAGSLLPPDAPDSTKTPVKPIAARRR
jgi:acetolactate synthase small subunit